MRSRVRLVWLALVLLPGLLSPGVAGETVHPLPALQRTAAWTAQPDDARVISVGEAPGNLCIRFRATKGTVGRVLLREPIPIPAEMTGVTFLGTVNNAVSGLYLHAILRDAAGKEFLAYTKSPGSYQKGVFFPEHSWRRCRQVRFTVPALARPVIEPRAGATLAPPANGVEPRLPFTLVGLYCEGEHQRPEDSFTELYLQDFTLTALSPAASTYYYQFNDQECYGEVDPLPYLTLGDFGRWYGKHFAVSWEVRDRYDGQPFLTGGKAFVLGEERAELPYALQLAQRIEFPVNEEGTYWVRVKLRWSQRDGPVPEWITERECRLYVVKGKPPVAHPPIAAGASIPQSFIRIAPDRPSLIFSPAEPVRVSAAFQAPGPGIANPVCRVRVRPLNLNADIKTAEAVPAWQGDAPFRMTVDLAGLPPGAYRVEATLLADGKPVDCVERVIGKSTNLKAKAGAIPASVPSWQQVLARETPTFPLSPMIQPNLLTDTKSRWDILRDFMNEAGGVSREMEYAVLWRDLEPLPGVYDWQEMDRVLDYAREKGIAVLLAPQLVGSEPEWLPSLYTRNKDGAIFGHTSYLFYGARLNHWHAAPVREAAMRLLSAVAARYAAHPAVLGYYVITEHPGEAPYAGWFDGYDEATLATFRRYARERWKTLAALNRQWGMRFAAWEAIMPPARNDLPQYWLDWMRSRMGAIHQYLLDGATAIRRQDPKRLIVIYSDGIDPDRLADFRALGCMLTNGGSHDPERGGPAYMAVALQGMQERTEDHSPGQWSAYFPTQLDASLFAMTLGGGGNAHCKAFIFTGKPFADLRKPPYSLDRYEHFQPIWTELRGAEMLPVDAFVLDDFSARLLSTRSTYYGGGDPWRTMACFQSHLLCPAGPLTLGEHGKLLLATGANVECLEEKTLSGLVRYVEQGGTLVMRADAGRTCVETPAQAWALLARFGIAPPSGPRVDERYTKAVPVAGEVFPAGTPPFVLRELWPAGPQPGMQPLALFDSDPAWVAMSWKPFGKGKVVVIWASTIVPLPAAAGHGGPHPFLRDLARWAGVRLYTDATSPHLWTNLLKHKGEETWYGLAYHSVWQNSSTTPITGAVRYQLPAGQYEVTELISGTKLGTMSAEQLAADGITLTLAPRAVAVYRMTSAP